MANQRKATVSMPLACRPAAWLDEKLPQSAFLQEPQSQPRALAGLLELQHMAGAGHKGIVVPVLGAERLVGAPGRRSALEIRVGPDELHGSAEIARPRPQVHRQGLRIDA